MQIAPFHQVFLVPHLLYPRFERGTVKVERLAQKHNVSTCPGLKTRSPDPESSPLTINEIQVNTVILKIWNSVLAATKKLARKLVVPSSATSVCFACV